MVVEYWSKKNIKELTKKEQSTWFDAYNYGLEMDRGYYLEKMSKQKTADLKNDIKQEYLEYLYQLINDQNFLFYTILLNENKRIISLCRLMKRENKIYISGLETHRDFRQHGYAKQVLVETITHAFKLGYDSIHSVVRKWNEASIQTHLSVGFKVLEDKGDTLVLSYANIDSIVHLKIDEFLARTVDYCKKINEFIDQDDIQLNYEIQTNNTRYIAKLQSSNNVNTEKLFATMKRLRDKDPNNIQSPILLESKRYGLTHKYTIYGRDYWLWIEGYNE